MIRLLIVDDHEMVREGLKAMLVAEPDFAARHTPSRHQRH